MKPIQLIFLLGFLAAPLSAVLADDKAAATIHAKTNEVEFARYDWFDAKRNRNVPVKIYFPKDTTGALPVIVFSHGLGGSREGYEYLGNYWAAHGYVSVHVQHLGSDNAVWEDAPVREIMGRLREAADKPANITNRPLDISFAIDQLEKLNREDPAFKNRLDLKRLGVAGHSFGAFTTMAIAGEIFKKPAGDEISFGDSRVKAVVVMSAQAPADPAMIDRSFAEIKIPCFHMTGTEDSSPIRESKPEERRVAFDHTRGVDEFLLTFTGGDHMVFARPSRALTAEKSQLFQDLICKSSTAFWDAYLKQDEKAKTWLAQGGFKNELGANGVFEEKLIQ